MIKALKCEDWDTKWAVVDALGTLGKHAIGARRELVKLVNHRSGIIAGAALEALKKIDAK